MEVRDGEFTMCEKDYENGDTMGFQTPMFESSLLSIKDGKVFGLHTTNSCLTIYIYIHTFVCIYICIYTSLQGGRSPKISLGFSYVVL